MRERQEVQVLLRPAPKTMTDALILLGRFVPLECFRDGRLHFLAAKILRQDSAIGTDQKRRGDRGGVIGGGNTAQSGPIKAWGQGIFRELTKNFRWAGLSSRLNETIANRGSLANVSWTVLRFGNSSTQGRTPSRPEVQEDELALEVGKLQLLAVQRLQGEIRRSVAEL